MMMSAVTVFGTLITMRLKTYRPMEMSATRQQVQTRPQYGNGPKDRKHNGGGKSPIERHKGRYLSE
jgi:hypothetical protein